MLRCQPFHLVPLQGQVPSVTGLYCVQCDSLNGTATDSSGWPAAGGWTSAVSNGTTCACRTSAQGQIVEFDPFGEATPAGSAEAQVWAPQCHAQLAGSLYSPVVAWVQPAAGHRDIGKRMLSDQDPSIISSSHESTIAV